MRYEQLGALAMLLPMDRNAVPRQLGHGAKLTAFAEAWLSNTFGLVGLQMTLSPLHGSRAATHAPTVWQQALAAPHGCEHG